MRIYRVIAPTIATAAALAEVLISEGRVATWLNTEDHGPCVLAECTPDELTAACQAVWL